MSYLLLPDDVFLIECVCMCVSVCVSGKYLYFLWFLKFGLLGLRSKEKIILSFKKYFK